MSWQTLNWNTKVLSNHSKKLKIQIVLRARANQITSSSSQYKKMQKFRQITARNERVTFNQSFRLQRPDSWILRLELKIYYVKSIKMGQVLACCTVNEREANDDTKYCPSSQEIEQPWKERIETNEGKVVLAVDPNFTEEEIAHERMKILTSI